MPRQNGKGEIILVRELAGLVLFGERLIIHSAHEYKTAAEGFLRIQQVFENVDWLRRLVKTIRTSHGEEGIELKNGNRLRFLARSKGSGRGFTADCIINDEAMYLGAPSMAAMLPTLSSRPNPQVWYLGSAGTEESTQFASIRVRGTSGNPGRLTYNEWSWPEGADPTDPRNHAMANPAMNIRISGAYIVNEQETLPSVEFSRERGGVWTDGKVDPPIDPYVWGQRMDRRSAAGEVIAFAVDMAPDRSSAAIGSASIRMEDMSRQHLELIDYRSGTRWLVDRMQELHESWGPVAWVLDPGGPAGALMPELMAAGFDLRLLKTAEASRACGTLQVAVQEDLVRHIGQPALDTAIGGAASRPVGDSWLFSRKDSTDICPLVAVTYAKFGLDEYIAEGLNPADNVW